MYEVLKSQFENHITKADMAHLTIESKIDNLRDNHIHHLSLGLIQLKSDIWWVKLIGGFIIMNLVGILVALLVK